MAYHSLSAALDRIVQLRPSGEVITRLPVPVKLTAQNRPSSGDQQTDSQSLSAALVRVVQVTPSGDVITRLPEPLKATAQNMMEDGAGALESTDRALAALMPLAAADPKNAEAQRDLAFAHSERGRALALLNRSDEARLAFAEAVRIREKLLAADPSNAEERRELAKLKGLQQRAQPRPM
jgi:hypothetical protein